MVIPALIKKEETVVVGMGEYQVSKQSTSVLACLGLGSCIAICVYDPTLGLGGMAHVVLPQHGKDENSSRAKYADTAVPFLIHEMEKFHGDRSRFVVKLVGGAQISVAPGFEDTFKTGERNAAMVLQSLANEKITVAATDIGGNRGRTVRMFLDTGKVMVRVAGGDMKELS